jgi:hypothetical protein
MIADLDETLRKLLVEELPVKNGEIDIEFDQPNREWSAKLTKPTVNLFLYDLRENAELRHHQYMRMNGNGRNNTASFKKTPMRVECYYMMTTWAAEAEDEHRLMTRCLMALYRHPVLPEHLLVGSMQHPIFDIQTRLARQDRLTNPAEVWSALDNEMRPSVSYTVTLTLDPWTEIDGPIVRTLRLRSGQATRLPIYKDLDEGTAGFDRTYIAGTVRNAKRKDEPEPGLQVAIKGTGWMDTTDEQGRFSLGGMPQGDYTLVVWPSKGKPKERKISVPAADGDYDLEI